MTKTNPIDKRLRISVALIVRDEADVLAETLDSVRPIADEIVVADLGSADGTLEIARRSADLVLEADWHDNYAAARNECLRRATGDWVLWIEAGEALDDTAAEQLRQFVEEAADPSKAYMLLAQRPATNAANSCEQIGQLRLMPNRAGLKFTGRVREQLLPALKQAGLGIDVLDCAISSFERPRNGARERAQARQLLNLANLAIAEHGQQPRPLLARAEALAQLDRPHEAGAVYRQAIEAADNGSSEMLEAYYGLLTSMDADPAAAEVQTAACLEALNVYPLDAQLLCGMGSYLLRAQRLDLAARSYQMAATHGKVDPSIWHLADLADVAVVCWSLATKLLGDAAQAESILNDALAERPESIRLRRQLVDMLVRAGRQQDALAHCRLLPSDAPNRAVLPQVVRGAVLAAARKPEAALEPLRAAFEAGCRDPLCLRWLASAYLALENWGKVAETAAEWERHEPGNLEVTAIRRALEQDRGRSDAARSHRVDKATPTILPAIPPAAFSSSPSSAG